MRAFHTPASARHDPDRYFRRGQHRQPPRTGGSLRHPPEGRQRGRMMSRPRRITGSLRLRPCMTPAISPFCGEALVAAGRSCPGWKRRSSGGHFARPHMHRRPQGMLGLIVILRRRHLHPDPRRHLGGNLPIGASGDQRRRCGFARRSCLWPVPSAGGHHAYADSRRRIFSAI